MKLEFLLLTLMMVLCVTACSSDDEPKNAGESSVSINTDGSTSNGSVFSMNSDGSFFIDHIRYEIVDSHIEIVGFDQEELHGDIRPYGVIKIGGTTYNTRKITNQAFSESKITSVVIPSTVTTIESSFNRCEQLKEVIFPESVTDIVSSFDQCEQLKEVIFPESVTKIVWSFDQCEQLKEVIFPESVTEIVWSFNQCEQLINVSFPGSITRISGFSYCPQLKDVVFPESVKSIIGFDGYSGEKINLPKSLRDIGGFGWCNNLTEVYFPESVESIGAFHDCSSLNTVIIEGNPSFELVCTINPWALPQALPS